MPYIKSSDVEIFYILHKSYLPEKTESIILIHGAGGNHLSMLSIFNNLKKKYGTIFNILVFDLPFHFRSFASDLENSLNQDLFKKNICGITYYAEILNSILSKIFDDNNHYILIGHSMGAQVCLKYASLFPYKTKKAMLIAGCHNTFISDSFIKSLEKSFERTIILFLKDALASKNKSIIDKALTDIKRTNMQVVINDFKYSKYYVENYETDINVINRFGIFFNLIYSKNDLIIREECMIELHRKINSAIILQIPVKNHVDFLYDNYLMEKEIDKFLLT